MAASVYFNSMYLKCSQIDGAYPLFELIPAFVSTNATLQG